MDDKIVFPLPPTDWGVPLMSGDNHATITVIGSRKWAEEHGNWLYREVNRALHAYHVLNQPIMDDIDFDRYFNQLIQMERDFPDLKRPDSPTLRVGGLTRSQTDVRHLSPMISLDNVFNDTELSRWFDGVYEQTSADAYRAELKYDGIACNLIYRNGILESGITRGDGSMGEDITVHCRTLPSIPLALNPVERSLQHNHPHPTLIEIRGEIVMPRWSFDAQNAALVQNNEAPYVNPRNAVAGILRQLNSAAVANKGLLFIAHGVGVAEPESALIEYQDELMSYYLRNWGFHIPDSAEVVKGVSGITDYYSRVMHQRAEYPYDIDGVVFKVNDRRHWVKLGSTSRVPRYAIAYKFPAEEKNTGLHDIVLQVGRTGKVTPVAKVNPVFVGGVTVTSVTLHNFDEIDRLGVRVGDTVVVRRAGDVIPQITAYVKVLRPPHTVPYIRPITCPVCNTALVQTPGEVALRCPAQYTCKAQLVQSIIHFASRKALDIEGLGERIAEALVEQGFVKRFEDLFLLENSPEYPVGVGLAAPSWRKLLDSIAMAAETTLVRFLYALGMLDVGESTARDIASYCGTWERFIELVVANRLMEISGIGPVTAANITNYINHSENRYTLMRLFECGVVLERPKVTEPISIPLVGQNLVITGSFGNVNRDHIKSTLIGMGARVSGSVSAKTTGIIVGDGPGSKLADAQRLNIPVIYSTGTNQDKVELDIAGIHVTIY
jgi:DNA ligase (NAD+)